VAIADIFHAMTSKRIYRDPLPFYEVMNQMLANRFGKLDPNILSLFATRIMESLLGKLVLLSNGERGTIRFIDPFSPTTPIIETTEEFLDLKNNHFIKIEEILV
jgi:HD-GYP domain-containing protein (c-di-GMP phosphodiesterase class II)